LATTEKIENTASLASVNNTLEHPVVLALAMSSELNCLDDYQKVVIDKKVFLQTVNKSTTYSTKS